MSQKNKSVLFTTSAGSDVQYSGGEILIAGLDAVKLSRVINFSQINYRAEVPQVVTIGATAYIPTPTTNYGVLIGDVSRVDHGYTENLKKYSYTTPDDITTLGATAALQREAITLKLVAEINSLASNFVVASTLTLGNGFTVTDDAGYFPYNRQGSTNRRGASIVRPITNADGTGYAASNVVLTTAAVYEFGTGLNLLNNAPVYDFMTGNLISGEIDTPLTANGLTAVSGQKYNMFNISYLDLVALPTAFNGTSRVYLIKNQTAYVDNGQGASTANIAGYISFARMIQRGLFSQYSTDPSAQIDYLDNVILFQGAAGAVPTTTGENKMLSDAKWVYTQIGTNTITVPTPGSTGLILDQDLTATEGAEYTPSLLTSSPKEFVVGKTDISVFARYQATTVANSAWLVGLRVKAAHSATFSYSGLAAIGTTAAAATTIATQGSLNGTVVSTATAITVLNATSYTAEVLVNKNGVVTCKLNDISYPVYSVGTTPLVLPAGMVVIPFFRNVNVNGAASVAVIAPVVALPAIWKS
jgi:hypothetical protein